MTKAQRDLRRWVRELAQLQTELDETKNVRDRLAIIQSFFMHLHGLKLAVEKLHNQEKPKNYGLREAMIFHHDFHKMSD